MRQATAGVALVFGLIALMLVVWPRGVFGLLAPGLTTLGVLPSTPALMVLALSVPLTAAAGVSTAYLNAREHFLVPGCGTLIFNACVIAALQASTMSRDPLLTLAIGVAAGALMRSMSQWIAMPAHAWRAGHCGLQMDRHLVAAFVASTGAASLMLLVPVIVRAIASTVGGGAIASFNYASKLVELPVGILIGTIGTVALSRMSASHAEGDIAGAQREARHNTRQAVLLGFAVTVTGCWFAEPLVSLVLGRGEMSPAAIARVVVLTQIALLGVPLVAISTVAVADLNARGGAAVVFRATAWALLLLPLFCIPGLIWQSERLLMGALVAFQGSLAVALVCVGTVRPLGVSGWMDATMLSCLVLSGALAGSIIAADWVLQLHSNWLRLVVAILAFGASAVLPMRWLKRPPEGRQAVAKDQ